MKIKMKIKMKIIKTALIMLIACIALVSCANSRFSSSGTLLKDKHTNTEYNVAPSCYEPVSLGKEIAREDKGSYEKVYYQMGELSESEWLTDDSYNVFYAEGIKLPTFEEMMCNRLLVCKDTDQLVSLFDITDSTLVSAVIEGYLNGEPSKYISLGSHSVLKLKFRSAVYPYLQYSLTYYEYPDGCVYEDTTSDIENYKYLANDEFVDISVTENSDGTYTVRYDYGSYFIHNEADGTYVKVGKDLADIIRGNTDDQNRDR